MINPREEEYGSGEKQKELNRWTDGANSETEQEPLSPRLSL